MRKSGYIILLLLLGFSLNHSVKAQIACIGGTATMDVTSTDVLCNGDSTGSISVIINNGAAPYRYRLISTEPTFNVDTTISVANYTFNDLPVDPSGYLIIAQPTNPTPPPPTSICQTAVFISEPSEITRSGTVTDNTCYGGNTGAIDYSVSGGTSPYGYTWSTGATSEDINGLTAGTYWVEVTDDNGCSETDTFIVDEPIPYTINGSVTDVSCNGGSDGQVQASVTGGTPTFTYSWSDGQSGDQATGLSAGNITVTVTDGIGCVQDSTFTVDEPLPITIADNLYDVSCNGGTDGAIKITPSGGNPGYTYSWSNGASSDTLSNLAAGTYTVTVGDSKGCTAVANYTINEPGAIVINESINNVSCNSGNDGNIKVNISGGTFPYSYSWSNGATSDSVFNLSAGAISVTVTDNNGCTSSESYTITQPFPLTLNANISDVTPCNGGSNGAIGLTVSGGTPAYNFNWSNGATTNPISGLTANTYSVTVTDNRGCQVNASYTVNEPLPLTLSATITDVICNGDSTGEINTSVSNGTAPYTYLWSNGSTSATLSNVPAGNYTLQVTDDNGCTINDSYTISENPAITSTGTIYNPTCFSSTPDGAVKVTASGGIPGYSYLWDTGSTSDSIFNITTGSYIVTITDAVNCSVNDTFDVSIPNQIVATPTITNVSCPQTSDGEISVSISGGTPGYNLSWSNGGTTNTISSLDTGNYILEITDANSCLVRDTFYVDINNPIIIDTTITHPSCFGDADGAISLNVSGGVLGYTYLWSTGSTADNVSGLADGTYYVEVRDATNCLATDTFDIVEPAPKVFTPFITDVSCNGGDDGNIFLTVSGGTAPYTFTWSNGETSNNPTNLTAGTYTVIVSDANLCDQPGSFTVNEPSAITTTGTIYDPTCFNSTFDGAIKVNVAGGTPGYTYNWSTGATSDSISSLNSGTYSLIVTDNNGCTDSTGYNVTNPPAIVSTPTITNLTCNASGDGEISIVISGGTPGYTTNWSNGQTNATTISNLDSNIYWVDITDDNNCVERDSFTVTEPLPILASPTVYDVSCASGTDGAIKLNTSGGTAPYSYSWISGETADTISAKGVGNYSVRITDNNGCIKDTSITIEGPAPFAFNETVTNVSCFGLSDGSISLTPSGGTTPYTYLWTNGATTKDINTLNAGSYGVRITDVNGCTDSTGFTITQPIDINNNALITSITCNGGNDGAISVSTVGGSSPYNYLWNTGATSTSLTNLTAGQYTLETTDAAGCIKRDTFNLNNPTLVSGTLAVTDTVCFGENIDVLATLSSAQAPHIDGAYSFDGGITFSDINTFSFSAKNSGDTLIQVVFKNAKGCVSNVIDSTAHTLDTITADITPLVDPDCGGTLGQIEVTNISGGNPFYNISINGNPSFVETDTIFEDLLPGTHTINIEDTKGCTLSESITFTSSIVSNIVVKRPTCFSNCNGTLTLSGTSGGTSPYAYSLNDTTANPFTVNDSVFTGLCAGNYTVYIKDDVGCVAQFNTTITEPSPLSVTQISKRNISCNASSNGRITVQANGGAGQYKYKLLNDSTTTSGPATFSDLTDGSYTITITDTNGCGTFYNFTILPSQDLIVDIVEDHPSSSCNANDGEARINSISNGSGVYEFSLDGGTTFKDSLSIATEMKNLASGYYYFITSDISNGCLDTTTFIITEPSGVDINNINAAVSGPTCVANDGSVELTNVTGGTSPYSYGLIGVSDPTQNRVPQSSSLFENLITGFYYVSIIDANGCIYKYHFFIDAPLPLGIVASSTAELCNNLDGTISLSVSGGQTPYQVSLNDTITANGNGPFNFNSLPSGIYSLQVYDSSSPDSCAAGTTLTISSSRDDIIISTDSTICSYTNDGVMEIIGINKTGTGSYKYLYSVDDTNKTSFTNQTLYTNLAAGLHKLYVMQIDTSVVPNDTCIYTDTEVYYSSSTDSIVLENFVIAAPDTLDASIKTTPTDAKEENGIIWVYNLEGGTPGYIMSLNDTLSFTNYDLMDSTANVFENLAMGTYDIYFRDSKGCEHVETVTVDPTLFVTNVVTPNGDGENDNFVVLGLSGPAKLIVYNRWGAAVYISDDYQSNWGGANVSSGIYFYQLELEDGEVRNGWIHVLR